MFLPFPLLHSLTLMRDEDNYATFYAEQSDPASRLVLKKSFHLAHKFAEAESHWQLVRRKALGRVKPNFVGHQNLICHGDACDTCKRLHDGRDPVLAEIVVMPAM